MPTQVQHRRGTTAQHTSFTGAVGELTIDTDKDTVVVHDGATAGGIPLAKETGSAISATTLTTSGDVTHNGGTANGVTYLNASKVLTSGSALTFDGANLGVASTVTSNAVTTATLTATAVSYVNDGTINYRVLPFSGVAYAGTISNHPLAFQIDNGEQMRLTSTGLGIGTSSPSYKLHVSAYMGLGTQASSGAGAGISMIPSSTLTNWFVGSNYTVPGAFEITPSTAGGGSTFSTPALLIDSSGNVGIGTSSPQFKLQVAGVNGSISVTGSGYTTSPVGMVLGQYNSSKVYIQKPAGYALSFWDNATNDLMILDSSGNLLVGTTSATSGGGVLQLSSGITFPATQVASANANTLDDYEEGTWTPTLTGSSGSATVSSPCPRYTKIGNLVMITASINYSSSTLGGQVSIGGFPFPTSSASSYRAAAVFGYASGLVFSGQLATDIPDNATSGPLIYLVSGSTPSNVGFGASGAFQFTYTYQTS